MLNRALLILALVVIMTSAITAKNVSCANVDITADDVITPYWYAENVTTLDYVVYAETKTPLNRAQFTTLASNYSKKVTGTPTLNWDYAHYERVDTNTTTKRPVLDENGTEIGTENVTTTVTSIVPKANGTWRGVLAASLSMPAGLYAYRVVQPYSRYATNSFNVTIAGCTLDPNVSACGNLNTENTTYTLTTSLTSAVQCMNITAKNVTLDCQGNKISMSGAAAAISIGAYANATVKNCVLNVSAASSQGINLYGSSYATVTNNTITNTGATSSGVYIDGASAPILTFSTFSNNTFNSTAYYALYGRYSIQNVTITNSSFSCSGTACIHFDSTYSVPNINNTISNDTFVLSGGGAVYAVEFGLYYNSLMMDGLTITGTGKGLYLESNGGQSITTLRNSVINTSGMALYLYYYTNLNAYNNTMTSTSGTTISMDTVTAHENFSNSTITTNGATNSYAFASTTGGTVDYRFNNVTFVSTVASATNYPFYLTSGATVNITNSNFSTAGNYSAYYGVGSSLIVGSGNLQNGHCWYNLGAATNTVSGDVGSCSDLGTGCGTLGTPNTVYNLTQNIPSIGVTCFTIAATGVTLDCKGYSVQGERTAGTYGVEVQTSKNPPSIKNCVINGFADGIHTDGDTQTTTISNNTIKNNSNAGVNLANNFYNNGNLSGNTITNNSAYGVQFGSINAGGQNNFGASNNVIANNTQWDFYFPAASRNCIPAFWSNNTGTGGGIIDMWNGTVSKNDTTGYSEIIMCGVNNQAIHNVSLVNPSALKNNGVWIIESQNLTLSNFTVTNAYNGFFGQAQTAGNGNNVTIDSAVILNTTKSAISFPASGYTATTVNNCSITNSIGSVASISILTTTGNADYVTNNVITNPVSGSAGVIVFDNTPVNVSGNTITGGVVGSNTYCYYQGTRTTYKNNYASGCQYAFDILSGNNFTFLNNTINGTTYALGTSNGNYHFDFTNNTMINVTTGTNFGGTITNVTFIGNTFTKGTTAFVLGAQIVNGLNFTGNYIANYTTGLSLSTKGPTVGNPSNFWNNTFIYTSKWVNNANASNNFNVSGVGNVYYLINGSPATANYTITSTTNTWADGGSSRPFNATNTAAYWTGVGADWFPWVGGSGPTNSCTYSGSGIWNLLCSDNCTLSVNTNLLTNNINLTGAGVTTITANITNWTRLIYTPSAGTCWLNGTGWLFKQ